MPQSDNNAVKTVISNDKLMSSEDKNIVRDNFPWLAQGFVDQEEPISRLRYTRRNDRVVSDCCPEELSVEDLLKLLFSYK